MNNTCAKSLVAHQDRLFPPTVSMPGEPRHGVGPKGSEYHLFSGIVPEEHRSHGCKKTRYLRTQYTKTKENFAVTLTMARLYIQP